MLIFSRFLYTVIIIIFTFYSIHYVWTKSIPITDLFTYYMQKVIPSEEKHMSQTTPNQVLKDKFEKVNSKDLDKKYIKKLSLLDLFKNDFNTTFRFGSDWNLTLKDGQEVKVKTTVYADFDSQTKFLGFYITSTTETFKICAYLAEHYNKALEDQKKNIAVESSAPGLQPVNMDELKFSRRVFIYHESPLFDTQKRELFDLFKKQSLAVQFRGSEYLFEKRKL